MVPPAEAEVIIYFLEKGCSEKVAADFFQHYGSRQWKNQRGTLLRNWKAAAWDWIWKYDTISILS